MSRWRDARVWAPALVAAGCLLGVALAALDPVTAGEQGDRPREPRITQEARALLGGLEVGEKLMGWTVQALDGPHGGELRVDLGRDDVRFALMIVRKGASTEAAPLETERYSIFYGHVQPSETSLPEGTIRATTHALARRIRANEAKVEVPEL